MEANQSRFLRHLSPEKDPKESSLRILKEFRYSGKESPQNLKTNFYHFAQNETLNLVIWVVLGKDYTRKKFIITMSRRPSCNSSYELTWWKWDSWCAGKEISLFYTHLSQMQEFLSQLLKNGLQNRTTNNYSSTTSVFHKSIQKTPVRKHWRACTLHAEIFNNRSLQPRYRWLILLKQIVETTRIFQN